ncbi:urease accessory protein UreF [Rhodophyticola porphyridii]|uniref:urease accessory protein UreF n=1 Tax=Rhodophyticola porphyridii TaxID=1852017 RepID=UPI0035D0BAAA
MAAPIPMPIEAALPDDGLLRLTQWLSPGFPVSAYAYSHGLEAAMEAGEVTDAASLSLWIEGVLRAGAGRNDAILLGRAMAGEDPASLAEHAEALVGSAERWEETRDQGAALARTLTAMGHPVPPLPYPVALGVAAAGLAVPAETVARLMLHAFAANLVSAGVRFIPLGQSQGQAVLAGLHGAVAEVAAKAAGATLDDLGGAAFGADLAAMIHERLEVRLFRS